MHFSVGGLVSSDIALAMAEEHSAVAFGIALAMAEERSAVAFGKSEPSDRNLYFSIR